MGSRWLVSCVDLLSLVCVRCFGFLAHFVDGLRFYLELCQSDKLLGSSVRALPADVGKFPAFRLLLMLFLPAGTP